ncbi:hypothetical protein [Nostoc sp.]
MPKALHCANASPTPVACDGKPVFSAGSSLLEQQDWAGSHLQFR